MTLPAQLVEVAREHINPAPEDDAAFMAALESAVAMAEDRLSMSLTGRQHEDVVVPEGSAIGNPRRFWWRTVHDGIEVVLRHQYTGPVEVSVRKGNGWVRKGTFEAVAGKLFMDAESVCDCNCPTHDTIMRLRWRTDRMPWPWPSHVVQGILRLAKHLYEQRGDEKVANPVVSSGAAAIWGEHVGAGI